jgi:YVTN family beta-propeller protein
VTTRTISVAAACVATTLLLQCQPNGKPYRPSAPVGPAFAAVGDTCAFYVLGNDPDVNDSVSACFDWGDGTEQWSGLVLSGDRCTLSHSWASPTTYEVKVRVKDRRGALSEWSDGTIATILSACPRRIVDSIVFTYGVSFVATSPDGEYVYVTQAPLGRVVKVRTSDNQVVKTMVLAGAWDMAFLPGGEFLYVACQRGFAVIRAADDSLVFVHEEYGDGNGIVALPGGEYVYVTIPVRNEVWKVRTADNVVVDSIGDFAYPSGLTASLNGDVVYVTDTDDNLIAMIRTDDDAVLYTGYGGLEPYDACTTPDGQFIYTACNDGPVMKLRASDCAVVDSLAPPYGAIDIDLTPDGSYLYVANTDDNAVVVVRTADNTVVDSIGVTDSPLSVAIQPDGRRAYVACYNHRVYVLGH